MSRNKLPITIAFDVLINHLSSVGRVSEWGEKMGYKNPKHFSRKFLNHYEIRPKKMMEYVYLISIIGELRSNKRSNFEIAKAHSMPDEKSLYKFINYHLGYSPTEIRDKPENEVNELVEKIDSKIRE